MDETNAPRARSRNRLILLACLFVAALSLLASDNILRSAALITAGIDMPQGASSLFTVSQSDSSPAPPRRRSYRRPASANNFDITATPPDIIALMEEALHEFADQVRDGNIVKRTYNNSDATHVWGPLAVRNTTATQAERDLSQDLTTPLGLEIDKALPSVLIFHTHTTEGFEILDRTWYAADWNSRTSNSYRNIVRVGEAMAQMLERAGFVVIHDTTIFDVPFAGAYDRSRVAVQDWLDRYPSIQVTIDVHRDAIHRSNGDRIRPVANVLGQQAAQVMLIAGVEEGRVAELPDGFPDWEQNLAMATQFHAFAQTRYPGVMKPLFFCPRRYNIDLTPFSMFFEIGTDVNTLQEAVFTGKLMGEALAAMLENYVECRMQNAEILKFCQGKIMI
jgi:stage II sporulation protein P